jgi:hypothetical protein
LNHFKSIELRLDDTDYMSTSVKEGAAAVAGLNGSAELQGSRVVMQTGKRTDNSAGGDTA